MKDKILVIVYVPLIGEEFEIYIPTVKKVGAIKNAIIKIIENNTDGSFKDDGCKTLYDKQTGEKIPDSTFVRNSIIKNGSRIILY